MNRGLYIVLEGINSCGKSLQQQKLSAMMKQHGYKVDCKYEPSYTLPIGNIIRGEYLTGDRYSDNTILANLYALDRYDQMINPKDGTIASIQNGIHVIQSRNYLSSVALEADYGMEDVCKLNDITTKLLKADVIFFIDLNLEEAQRRHHEKNKYELDIFESDEKLEKNYYAYKKAISYVTKRNDENIVIIDGNQSVDEVTNDIWSKIHPLLEN